MFNPAGGVRQQAQVPAHWLDHHRSGRVADSPCIDYPHLLSWDGRLWAVDGHHRLCVAVERGQTAVPVRVLDLAALLQKRAA